MAQERRTMPTCNAPAPEVDTLAAALRASLPAMPDGMPRALVQFALAVLTDMNARAAHVSNDAQPAHNAQRGLTTAQFCDDINREQSTVRRRLCETGSYFGVKPIKLASGRLLWPADSLEQLSRSGAAK
jgi:hypothetical protein